MSGAAIVLVLIATSDAHGAAATSMLRAASTALGDGTSLVVREIAAPLDDDDALAAASGAHATALVEVTWGDGKHLVAHVRVHVDGAARWSDRELGFEPADDEAERGRTVGFTLASMLPERAPAPGPAPPVPPLPPPPPAPISSAVIAAPIREAPTPGPGAPLRGSIDAAAIAGLGIGGSGGGIGASVAGRWSFSRHFALRLGASLRAGDVDAAAATSKTFSAALGAAWHFDLAPLRGFGVGARVDALLLREELSHFDFDDSTPANAARWIPGVDFLAEGDWRFGQSAGFFLAAGGEAAFGTTDVLLAGARVAVIPVLRGVVELGVRARF